MKKNRKIRLDKKLHQKYIADVVFSISLSSSLRKTIFDSAFGSSFFIDANNLKDLGAYSQKVIKRYSLQFIVEKYQNTDSKLCDVIFLVSSLRYPDITMASYNNSEILE